MTITPIMKEHLASALKTFLATFIVTLTTVVGTSDMTTMDKNMLVSITISSLTVALRAVIKLLVEPIITE